MAEVVATTRDKFDAHKARFAEHGLQYVVVKAADAEAELMRLQKDPSKKVRIMFAIDGGAEVALVFEDASVRVRAGKDSLLEVVEKELLNPTPDFGKLDHLIQQALRALHSSTTTLPPSGGRTIVTGSGVVDAAGSDSGSASAAASGSAMATFATSFGPVLSMALRRHCPSFRALERIMVTLDSSPWLVLTMIGKLWILCEMLGKPVHELVEAIHEDRELRRISWDIQTGVERPGWVSLSLLEEFNGVLVLSAKGTNIPEETRHTLEGFLDKIPSVPHHYHFDLRTHTHHSRTPLPQAATTRFGGGSDTAEEEEQEEEQEETWTVSRSEREDLAKRSMVVFDKLLGRARTVGL